jgi:uncharacterized protein YkwD
VALAIIRHRLITGVLTVLAGLLPLGLLTAVPATAATAAQTVTSSSAAAAADDYEIRLLRQMNRVRVNHGLPRVRRAACTEQVADRWSRHLAATGLFYHQSMTNILDKCSARYAGETLGRGTMTPRRLVRMWLNSPPHRAVLLSGKPRRIGLGVTPDSTGRWVVAANFMRF